jgi:hypothetical protein
MDGQLPQNPEGFSISWAYPCRPPGYPVQDKKNTIEHQNRRK